MYCAEDALRRGGGEYSSYVRVHAITLKTIGIYIIQEAGKFV